MCYDNSFQINQGERVLPEHISRKELKTDKIHDAIEHSAEAVYSHKQVTLIVLLVVLVVAAGYGGWSVYKERQTAAASAAFDTAMRAYSGRVGAAAPSEPVDPSEVSYPNEAARSTDALQKFTAVADKYPSTNPGRLAHYYSALCLEDLDRQNQALEQLKKVASGGDKELASMAQYQTAVIYARTGKTDDAVKIYRALADKPSAFVPRPLALLELAGVLRQSNPKEAANVYAQIKKEFPDSQIAEEADRGLDTLAPKS
jgi:predicted negative regulator of RcsB-dependent stress response